MKDEKRITCQIFVEERNDGTVWVPYKTLIGHGIGNRVIIGSRGELFYMNQEFSGRDAAVGAAKERAWETIRSKFGDAEPADIDWDIVHEGVPSFAGA